MADKRYGLKLKGENGEPNTAHTVPPLPGFFFVDVPTPVGGEGEIPLDVARRALKPAQYDDDGQPVEGKSWEDGYHGLGSVLELVSVKGSVQDAQEAQTDAIEAARNGIAAQRRDARDRPLSTEERERLNQETVAVQGTAADAEGSD